MSSNEWIEVKNTQSVSRVPTVTITPDKKFTFSTKMLKEFKLTQKVSVTYLVNRKRDSFILQNGLAGMYQDD